MQQELTKGVKLTRKDEESPVESNEETKKGDFLACSSARNLSNPTSVGNTAVSDSSAVTPKQESSNIADYFEMPDFNIPDSSELPKSGNRRRSSLFQTSFEYLISSLGSMRNVSANSNEDSKCKKPIEFRNSSDKVALYEKGSTSNISFEERKTREERDIKLSRSYMTDVTSSDDITQAPQNKNQNEIPYRSRSKNPYTFSIGPTLIGSIGGRGGGNSNLFNCFSCPNCRSCRLKKYERFYIFSIVLVFGSMIFLSTLVKKDKRYKWNDAASNWKDPWNVIGEEVPLNKQDKDEDDEDEDEHNRNLIKAYSGSWCGPKPRFQMFDIACEKRCFDHLDCKSDEICIHTEKCKGI